MSDRPAYTKANLEDLPDRAPEFGLGRIQEARFGGGPLHLADTGFAHHRLKPGCRQGFGHRHEGAEEVVIVLDGSGRVRLDDQTVELRPRDALRISPTVARRFEAGEHGLEFLVFGPARPGDGEMLPEFWAPED